MQRFTDLEQKELAVLEDAAVERLIDLEIAEAGILPVPCPVVPDLVSVGIAKNDMAFEVAGVVVRTEEEAQQIAEMAVLKSDYDYNIGYSYQWLKPQTDLELKQVAFYQQPDVVRVSAALVDIERKKKVYDAEKTAYDGFLEKTGEHRNRVWLAVHEARSAEREIEFAEGIFQKHMELAENDVEIARRFFTNAYEDRPEILKAVLGVEVAEA